MVNIAMDQTRLMGKSLEKSRARRRASVMIGIMTAFGGLAGSILITLETGAASNLWWLTIPTWIFAATPIIVLRQDGFDTLAALHARSAGIVAMAHEVSTAVNGDMHRIMGENSGADGLEALTHFLEQDVEATGQALSSGIMSKPARRRHRRIVPRKIKVMIATEDGRRFIGNIGNVSLSGVAMTEALPRLSVGDRVLVGRTRATVARSWTKGIAFEFECEMDPTTFDENIVL